MIYEIPFINEDGNQEFDITLDEVVYRLRFTYNSRLNKWAMDILSVNGTELLCGVLMVLGVDFLAQYVSKNLPSGKMYLVNLVDGITEANETSFGVDVRLYYETV